MFNTCTRLQIIYISFSFNLFCLVIILVVFCTLIDLKLMFLIQNSVQQINYKKCLSIKILFVDRLLCLIDQWKTTVHIQAHFVKLAIYSADDVRYYVGCK